MIVIFSRQCRVCCIFSKLPSREEISKMHVNCTVHFVKLDDRLVITICRVRVQYSVALVATQWHRKCVGNHHEW